MDKEQELSVTEHRPHSLLSFKKKNQTFRQTSAVQESKRNIKKKISTAKHNTVAKEALEMHCSCTDPSIQLRQQSMRENNGSGKHT